MSVASSTTAANSQPASVYDLPTFTYTDHISYGSYPVDDAIQRPMLNNYVRYARVGVGQHGEVYLCHRIDTTYPEGHPSRRIPVVCPPLVPAKSYPNTLSRL